MSSAERRVFSRGGAAENKVAIAAAGAIKPLVALLRSTSTGVQEAAAVALWNVAANGARPGRGGLVRVLFRVIVSM